MRRTEMASDGDNAERTEVDNDLVVITYFNQRNICCEKNHVKETNQLAGVARSKSHPFIFQIRW